MSSPLNPYCHFCEDLVLLVLLLKEANEIALKKSRENEGLIEKLKRNLANREQQIEVRQVIVAL